MNFGVVFELGVLVNEKHTARLGGLYELDPGSSMPLFAILRAKD